MLVAGAPADKPARLVGAADPILVTPAERAWASRGGHKLDAALGRFGVAVAGRRCLDAGASTGGFTDVLLEWGAAEVWAVDVGRGQLIDRLRRDPRVTALDKTNVRTVTLGDVGGVPFEIVTADLSFISLRSVALTLARDVTAAAADLIWLVKPQFEAGRQVVSAGRGVVREAQAWREALLGVGTAIGEAGAAIMGAMCSPLRGADGNVEFLMWARAHTSGGDLHAAVEAALAEVDA